jgi:nicotinate-nucleotide adenylyltransferase
MAGLIGEKPVRLGLFGGTFDPPHLGHLILAAEALDQLQLDRLLWVLTPDPPHKHNRVIGPLEQRLELVQAAIDPNPAFELSSVDIDRSPPHYAVDTVNLLAAQFPGCQLFYLMGGDSLHDLPDWYHPQAFLDGCTGIGVMRRPDDQIDLDKLELILTGIKQKTHLINSPLLEISSKQIRERIRLGHAYRYYLSDKVYQLIRQKGYYQ